MAAAVSNLNALLRGTTIEDHDEALKVANAAIRSSKAAGGAELLTAQHTKVVALLKLDRFEDALRAVAEGGDALAARCVVERAYALYKTGELAAAEALLEDGDSSRALAHIAAQAAYRAEGFARAAALYARLAGDAETAGSAGSETLDVRVNALATRAQQLWGGASGGDAAATDRNDLEAFETAYNAGCGALAGGDAQRAAVLLRRAQQLCEASEELAEADKRAELQPILAQQAYAQLRLGQREAAAARQAAVDLAAVEEGSTRAVAQTNAVVTALFSGVPANPYAVQRQISAVPPPAAGNDRVFAHQARILRRNQLAVELQCFKFKGVQARTASPADADLVDYGVLHAAAQAEMQTGTAALRRLQPLLARRPDDVGLLLTVVQLHLQAHNPEAALSLLEAFFARIDRADAPTTPARDLRFAPGLVALAVALYKRQGRHAAVRSELARAVAHWQTSLSAAAAAPPSLLRAAGIELLRSPAPADQAAAAAAFAQLHAADPHDRLAAAGLVAAAPADADSAALAASLTPVDELVRGVDVAALLQGGVAVLPSAATTVEKKKKRPAQLESDAAAQPTKKAKTALAAPPPTTTTTLSRQARRLQAQAASDSSGARTFDAAKTPDPERWLPLRDRSSYRPPKGKKGGRARREAAAASMQGGLVKEEETLALAGGAGSVKVEKAPGGGGGGGGGGGKKRKKGKK